MSSCCSADTPIGNHSNADPNTVFCGFAAYKSSANVKLQPWKYHPRPLHADEIEIIITHCGICFSDIHTVTGGWGAHDSPIIPGHEIVGHIGAVGAAVTGFTVGARVGVGAQSNSCLQKSCKQCARGKENCCPNMIWTYGSAYPDGQVSQGGYADRIRANAHFVFHIPDALPSAAAAPLLCAGATVYNPFLRFKIGPGSRVGIIGIGGLGHLGVQFASKMGAEVTAISHSDAKFEDAKKLGAIKYLNSSDKEAMAKAHRSFDFILNTANFNTPDQLSSYISLVDVNGTFCVVALPEKPFEISPFSLLLAEVNFCASAIGSHADIVSMLEFAAKHDVRAWIEEMPLSQCNEGIAKVRANQVRFRVVLDASK